MSNNNNNNNAMINDDVNNATFTLVEWIHLNYGEKINKDNTTDTDIDINSNENNAQFNRIKNSK